MKSVLSVLLLLATTSVIALSDKEKSALTTFGRRYHPADHAPTVLVSELAEYSTNAGLADINGKFARRQYAQAAQGLSAHVRGLSSDPLVQHGRQFAEPFMMLGDCVGELQALYK